MGYGAYYLIWILVSLGTRSPWLLLGIVVFFLLRRFLPDPAVYLRTMGRIRRLQAEGEANPSNVTVRRDLARTYLQRRRPKKALGYLDEALKRTPDDAELLYLRGAALVDSGRPEEALEPLVRAVDIDPRVAFGEPYLIAGRALHMLGKLPEAEDSLLRYLDVSTSSVVARVQLARVLHRAGRSAEASKMIDEAISTHRSLPGYSRRAQLGARWDAEVSRITIQRDPKAIVLALLLVAGIAFVGVRLVPLIQRATQSFTLTQLTQARVPALAPSGVADVEGDDEGYDQDDEISAKVRAAMRPGRLRRLSGEEAAHAPLQWPTPPEVSGPALDLAMVQTMCSAIASFGAPDRDAEGNQSFVFVDTDTHKHAGIRLTNGSLVWAIEDSSDLQASAETQGALVMSVFAPLGDATAKARPADCAISYTRNGQARRAGYRGGAAFSEAASGGAAR